MYKNILVATDLHDKSLPVVSKAVMLAKEYGAKLSVITVGPKVDHYMPCEPSAMDDFKKKVDEESDQKLNFVKSQIDFEANYIKAYGIPKVEILSAIKSLQTDLLVIGSHGHCGVLHILGSTVDSVLHAAPCDVMLIRIQEKHAA